MTPMRRWPLSSRYSMAHSAASTSSVVTEERLSKPRRAASVVSTTDGSVISPKLLAYIRRSPRRETAARRAFSRGAVQSALDGVLVFVDVVHGQRVAVRGERLLDAFDHLGKQLVRRAGHHGDDAAAVDLLEVLRVGIELISAFLRQCQNGAACLLADIRQAVQGAGDRGRRSSRTGGQGP